MKDREKEIKKLIYEKSVIIKQLKKEIKTLRLELENINDVKRKVRKK